MNHDATELEYVHTAVIGGGQAGLATGYFLRRRNIPFLVLDAHNRIGDVWRTRWDSLRLFTPAKFNAIPGKRFPAPGNAFPTKDEMADYLESYVEEFRIPVRTGMRVDRLSSHKGRFVLQCGRTQIEADNVVVAMADFQQPRIPEYASDLSPAIVQIHSRDYRNKGQLQPGAVLVVGAGNSGAEIAKEVAGAHATYLSGRDVGSVPFKIEGLAARLILARVVLRVVFHRLLTLDTPVGRKVRQKVISQGGPLIRVKSRQLEKLGVQRVPRVTGVRDGKPELQDGRVLDVANIVWCTGFQSGFADWMDLPVASPLETLHRRGVVEQIPGLYFVGQHFQYAFSSAMIHGVGRDARHVASQIAEKSSRPRAAAHFPVSSAAS